MQRNNTYHKNILKNAQKYKNPEHFPSEERSLNRTKLQVYKEVVDASNPTIHRCSKISCFSYIVCLCLERLLLRTISPSFQRSLCIQCRTSGKEHLCNPRHAPYPTTEHKQLCFWRFFESECTFAGNRMCEIYEIWCSEHEVKEISLYFPETAIVHTTFFI